MKRKIIKFIVQEKFNNIAIIDYFNSYHINKSIINDAINNKVLFVNGKIIKDNMFLLYSNDVIEIGIKYEDVQPYNYNIDVIYEDEYIIAVNKPKNILVHTDGNTNQTLTNAVCSYLRQKDKMPYAYPIHRLDYETTGIVVFAKNKVVLSFLSVEIEKHNVLKKYVCLCYGKFSKKEGFINKAISSDRHSNKQIVCKNGKEALTTYKVIKNDDISKVEVMIKHGRKHQIRVHLNSLNHPLVGDSLYGIEDGQSLKLHFKYISFTHPYTREQIIIESKEDF